MARIASHTFAVLGSKLKFDRLVKTVQFLFYKPPVLWNKEQRGLYAGGVLCHKPSWLRVDGGIGMANDLLDMARREANQLRAELAKNATFQKLQIVQKMIEGYEAVEAMGGAPEREAPVKAKTVVPTRPGSKLSQVEDLVIAHTTKTGQRATSGALLKIMNAAGIMMGGKVPSKTLSSMLSNSTRLNNVQGFGYGPKEWGDRPDNMPGSTPADLLAGVSPNSVSETQVSASETSAGEN